MKQNIIYKYILLAFSVMLFASCEKDQEVLENVPSKQEPVYLKMSGGISELEIYDFDAETGEFQGEDDLRVTSIGQGYNSAPKLKLELDDIVANRMGGGEYEPHMHDKTVARWCVVSTSGDFVQANNGNKMTVDPEFGDAGRKDRTVVLEEKNGYQVVHMYYTWNNGWTFNPANTFACMFISGDNPKQGTPYYQYFDDERHTNPNAEIVGITTNSVEKRHIPILTDLRRITSPDYSSDNGQASGKTAVVNSVFRVRGSLLGLRLKNELGQNVIIKNIKVEDLENTPFYYQGYFDWRTPIAGKNIPRKTSRVDLTFTPETSGDPNQPELEYGTFPVYTDVASNSQNYELTTDGLDNDSPVFYIWGYQRSDKLGQPFKYRVTYALSSAPSVDYLSKIIAVNPPSGGFKEGVAYRTTTPVKFGKKLEAKVTNPLSYVAKFDVAHSRNAFVDNYNHPASDVLANLQPTDVGYFTYDDIVGIYQNYKNSFLSQYVVPNAAQCASIYPKSRAVYFAKEAESTPNETVQIGSDVISGKSTFKTISENARFVTYAIRFKGTTWQSAWRYYRDGSNLIVECVAGSKVNGVSLADISNPEFFSGVNLVTRTFPAYGYGPNYGDTSKIQFKGKSGGFWSLTSSGGFASASFFHLDNGTQSMASVNPYTAKAQRYAFRPYYKVAPQD